MTKAHHFSIISILCFLLSWGICTLEASDLDEQFRRDLEISTAYLTADNFKNTVYSLSFPHRFKKTERFDITGNIKTEYFHTKSNANFPSDLYRIGYYFRLLSERQHIWLNAKSYSDKPFNSIHDVDLEIIGAHKIPLSDESGLFVGLSYSSQRIFLKQIPLPVALYEYNKKPLYILAGIPLLNAKWDISEKASFRLSYIPVITIVSASASLQYRVNDSTVLGILADVDQNKFLLAGRQNRDEKLFLERVKAGFRVSKGLSASLHVTTFLGYAFNGRFYRGEKFNENVDKVRIDDAISVKVGTKYFFE